MRVGAVAPWESPPSPSSVEDGGFAQHRADPTRPPDGVSGADRRRDRDDAEPADDASARVRKVLTDARREGRRTALRVSAPSLLVGLTCQLLVGYNGFTGYTLWRLNRPIPAGSLTSMLNTASYTGLLLALPPGNPLANGLAAMSVGLFFGFFILIIASTTAPELQRIVFAPSCWAATQLWITVPMYLTYAVGAVVITAAMAWALLGRFALRRADGSRPISTEQLNHALWFHLGFTYNGVFALASLYANVMSHALARPIEDFFYRLTPWDVLWLSTQLAFTAFALSPDARNRVRSWLARGADDVSAAAGIASLFGGIPPKRAITEGSAHLRAVRFDRIPPDVFLGTSERPASTSDIEHVLSHPHARRWLTEPVKLGAIDAFVSHSWHDSPSQRWAALSQWRERFVHEHGREPVLWIDALCIQAAEVEVPLLPIFLASCQSLVVLAGPTYLERMWTISELFVFEQMHTYADGQSAISSGMVHVTVLPGGPSLEDLHGFDASHCRCLYEADREWLLTCCTAACGGLSSFNARTTELLARATWNELTQPSSAAGLRPVPAAGEGDAAPLVTNSGAVHGDAMPARDAPGPRNGQKGDAATLQNIRPSRRHKRMCVWACVWAGALALTAAFIVWAGEPARAACDACARLTGNTPGSDGWWAHGNSRYLLVRRTVQWVEARAECAGLGAQLARIDDRAEDAFVACLVGRHSGSAWIGLSQPAHAPPESGWTWADGSALGAYSNWAPDYPNRGALLWGPYSWETERWCAATGTTISAEIRSVADGDVGTRWFDAQCASIESEGFFVCERPA